jgi:hypothetical protein
MTIVYDPARRRSTHVESGLAVQWVRDEPPMERSSRFKLIAPGIEVEFNGSHDYGEYKMQKLHPDADFLEIHRLASDLREINYTADYVRATGFDEQLFLRVWQHLLRQERGHGMFRVSTYYTRFTGDDPESGVAWKCEG